MGVLSIREPHPSDDAEASRGGTFALTKPVLDDAATLALRGQWAEQGQHAVEALFELHVNDELTVSFAPCVRGGSRLAAR